MMGDTPETAGRAAGQTGLPGEELQRKMMIAEEKIHLGSALQALGSTRLVIANGLPVLASDQSAHANVQSLLASHRLALASGHQMTISGLAVLVRLPLVLENVQQVFQRDLEALASGHPHHD